MRIPKNPHRTVATALIAVGTLLLTVASIGIPSPAQAAPGECAPGAHPRTLSWATDQDPDNGAVWSQERTNKYSLGDGLMVTATLTDNGSHDSPSTLANSGLLQNAAPDQAGSLVWDLNSSSAENPPSSSLAFEFSEPVESFSLTLIDIDASSDDSSGIEWHDEVHGFADGENASVSLVATDPSVVTVKDNRAWSAKGKGKTSNESSAGNVSVSATGTIFRAGVSYGDGPRSKDNPERHAIGVSTLIVCIADSIVGPPDSLPSANVEGTTTTAPAESTEPSPPSDEDSVTTPATTAPAPTSPPVTVPAAKAEGTATPTTTPTTQPETPSQTGPVTSAKDLATPAEPSPTEPSPTENPTSVPTSPTEASLEVVTTVSDPTSNGGESQAVTYTIEATNSGDAPLNSLEVSYPLQEPLSTAKSWKVGSVSVSEGDCEASNSYDGDDDTNLVSAGTQLAAGDRCVLTVGVSITPTSADQRFASSASAKGYDPSSQVVTSPKADAAVVNPSEGAKALALTGNESEGMALVGALLLGLGLVVLAYRSRLERTMADQAIKATV